MTFYEYQPNRSEYIRHERAQNTHKTDCDISVSNVIGYILGD